MNLLLKRDRVIVSPIPGTTRDAVEEYINLKGLPIRLVDTAGVSRTKNLLDREGIKRSKRYIKSADMVLLMLDGSAKLDRADSEMIKLAAGRKKIVVVNKCDLAGKIEDEKLKELFKNDPVIRVSVKKKSGIDNLEKAIVEMVWSGSFGRAEDAIITSARHKALLDKAHRSMLNVLKALDNDEGPELVSVDLTDAVNSLGLIIGKSVSDDILDRIFGRFCIGK